MELLIIDPQVDFCEPGSNGAPKGALYVDNAENDMAKVAAMIDKMGDKIKKIHITLDCHHLFDVAHPPFWKNSEGKHPGNYDFTIITGDDIRNGVWLPTRTSLTQKMIDYCDTLSSGGRFPLCVWPPHCLIGSNGNKVLPVLFESLLGWQRKVQNNINFVSKGSNPFTEHYSAIKAEVPDPDDPTTQLNMSENALVPTLMRSSTVLIAGEAGSHCVKNTVEDIADGFQDDSLVSKLILLTDAVSPVQSPVVDFPAIQQEFIDNMKKRGMGVAVTTDF